MLQFNPQKDNMRAVRSIMDILGACGCNPTVTATEDGNAIIQVNAPAMDNRTEDKNNDR